MIRVGQITGAYGLDGTVKVTPLTVFTDRFDPGSALVMGETEIKVEWSKPGHPGLLVKFSGIDDRTTAERHRGQYLEVGDDQAHALAEGQYYHHQVVGLEARTAGGRPLGVIRDILERPANDVWVVAQGEVEQLIPATSTAVLEVDLQRRVVVIADWVVEVEEA